MLSNIWGKILLSNRTTLACAILAILCGGSVPLTLVDGQTRILISYSSATDTIIIDSDTDFVTYGWSGNGTASNPYVLSQETFDGENYIRIRDTRSFFRIENSTFNVDFIALSFYNVSNANITKNTITTRNEGICVSMSENITIIENTIIGGNVGLLTFFSSKCRILNNTIASIRNAVWLNEAFSITVIGNRLASVEIGNTAVDDEGADNFWDDDVSKGNSWFDYDGTGIYYISGTTNSIDRYPTIFSPDFPIDFEGPKILAPGGSSYIDYIDSLPSSWDFVANVSDPSGVDRVIITINNVEREMIHLPTSENPNQYVYTHLNPTTMEFSFWANDTLGYSSYDPGGYISLRVFPIGGPDSIEGIFLILRLAVIGSAIVFVGTFILLKRRKEVFPIDSEKVRLESDHNKHEMVPRGLWH